MYMNLLAVLLYYYMRTSLNKTKNAMPIKGCCLNKEITEREILRGGEEGEE
jgi:hypothetical protein